MCEEIEAEIGEEAALAADQGDDATAGDGDAAEAEDRCARASASVVPSRPSRGRLLCHEESMNKGPAGVERYYQQW